MEIDGIKVNRIENTGTNHACSKCVFSNNGFNVCESLAGLSKCGYGDAYFIGDEESSEWKPTMNLRQVFFDLNLGKILEQMWVNEQGEEEWREVPVVQTKK